MSVATILSTLPAGRVFGLADDTVYARWRDRKLAARASRPEDLVVEVRDPRALTAAERDALIAHCRRDNMAVYASRVTDEDKEVPRRLGAQLGLATLDTNFLADEDGITSIAVTGEKARAGYIPYTTHRIRWHTDGYYNPPAIAHPRDAAALRARCRLGRRHRAARPRACLHPAARRMTRPTSARSCSPTP